MVPVMYHDTPGLCIRRQLAVLAAMDNLVKKNHVIVASGSGLEGEYQLSAS